MNHPPRHAAPSEPHGAAVRARASRFMKATLHGRPTVCARAPSSAPSSAPASATSATSSASSSSSILRRAFVLLSALVLACALAPSLSRAQTAAQTKATPSPSPPPAADAGQEKPGGGARRGPGGTIKGRVVADDGQPLAYVALYLYGKSSVTASRQLPHATSDEEGKFTFDDIEPGLYGIRAYLAAYTAETDAGEPQSAAVYRVGDDATIRLARGGVITGTVTNADGEPVVGALVRVTRLRTLDNRPAPPLEIWFAGDQVTDDRGVYRVYGLPAGVYVVSAGGGQRWSWAPPTPYDADVPTYFRSATFDTAEEVTLRSGQEVGGVDLRYRGERGHTVSGTLVLPPGHKPDESVSISLSHAATGTNVASAMTFAGEVANSFSIGAVADGEYEVRAARHTNEGEGGVSPPLRVTVRGADVTGLRLTLTPFGSIGGGLALEPLREAEGACKTAARRALLPQEVLVAVLREDRASDAAQRRPATLQRRESAPSDGGVFLIRALEQGRYHLDARPADEGWYVRDIQLAATTTTATAAATAATSPTASPSSNAAPAATRPPAPRKDSAATNAAPRHALDLKPGQQLTGLRVTVAEGAASLAGRLAPREENAPLPPAARLRVHLVPAARELADNLLRYAETTPAADGSFVFRHLAPGRYLVLAREAETEAGARPAAWDSASRARLRREAEAANISAELQPCQQQTNFTTHLHAPRD